MTTKSIRCFLFAVIAIFLAVATAVPSAALAQENGQGKPAPLTTADEQTPGATTEQTEVIPMRIEIYDYDQQIKRFREQLKALQTDHTPPSAPGRLPPLLAKKSSKYARR